MILKMLYSLHLIRVWYKKFLLFIIYDIYMMIWYDISYEIFGTFLLYLLKWDEAREKSICFLFLVFIVKLKIENIWYRTTCILYENDTYLNWFFYHFFITNISVFIISVVVFVQVFKHAHRLIRIKNTHSSHTLLISSSVGYFG